MTSSGSPEAAAQVFALHTITSVPLDPHCAFFANYPGMKLGVRTCVRFYASLMAPLAGTILSRQPEETEWVLTAPPLYVLPSAANLLTWELARTFAEIGLRNRVRCADLRFTLPNPESQDFTKAGDYSNSGIPERVLNRTRLFEGAWAPRPDPADFQDRAVLVVNDINVTGTQQRFIQRCLESVRPASIHWLYLIDVDAALGREHPELEYTLNHLNLETFEEFAEVMAGDIDYTPRCIRRLFSYPEDLLEPLLRSFDKTRREELRQMVLREGSHSGAEHRSKLALLS